MCLGSVFFPEHNVVSPGCGTFWVCLEGSDVFFRVGVLIRDSLFLAFGLFSHSEREAGMERGLIYLGKHSGWDAIARFCEYREKCKQPKTSTVKKQFLEVLDNIGA
jgi:hypothetical protein